MEFNWRDERVIKLKLIILLWKVLKEEVEDDGEERL